jgi:tetratricopeptide (TPR) repeat protein
MAQDFTSESTKTDPVDDLLRSGWASFTKGDLDAAEANFRKASSLNPRSVEAHFALGISIKAQDRKKEAIKAFKQVITLIEENVLDDRTRGAMLRRLALGHINQANSGDWNLEKEIWKRKS